MLRFFLPPKEEIELFELCLWLHWLLTVKVLLVIEGVCGDWLRTGCLYITKWIPDSMGNGHRILLRCQDLDIIPQIIQYCSSQYVTTIVTALHWLQCVLIFFLLVSSEKLVLCIFQCCSTCVVPWLVQGWALLPTWWSLLQFLYHKWCNPFLFQSVTISGHKMHSV